MKSWGYKKQNIGYLKRHFKRSGAPEGIRIPDLRYRKPMLYPAELRAHIFV